jgi:hypothetical protein
MPDINWKSKEATQEFYQDVEGVKTLRLLNDGWEYRKESGPGGGGTIEEGHKDVKWILLNSLNQRHKIVDDTIEHIKKNLGATESLVIELGEALKWARGDTKPQSEVDVTIQQIKKTLEKVIQLGEALKSEAEDTKPKP